MALAVGDLEVADPSAHEAIQLSDLLLHVLAVVARCELPYTVLETLETLWVDRYVFPVDDEAQEGNTAAHAGAVRLVAIDYQLQVLFEDLYGNLLAPLCLSRTVGEDQDIVRIADDTDALRFHALVKRVQVDVAQQGGNHAPLGAAHFRGLPRPILHDAGCQELPDEAKHFAIADPALHPLED